jgi:hypothetical protein
MRMKRGARKPGEPELVSATSAAAMLGVGQSNLRTVAGFAEIEPYQKIEPRGTLWRATEIRELAEKRTKKAA